MARPTNASKSQGLYLKEQFQQIGSCLNQLEEVCRNPNTVAKDDFLGTIGLLVGKTMVRFDNLASELHIFDDE